MCCYRKYHAIADRGTPDEKRLQSERAFCVHCATMLWVYDSQWPELIHPFASAIDTPLPPPDEMVCVMACSKPDWVRWPDGEKQVFDKYGPDSIEECVEIPFMAMIVDFSVAGCSSRYGFDGGGV